MTLTELVSLLRAALEGRGEIGFAVLFGSAAKRGPDHARDVDVALSFNRPMPWLELAALAGDLEQVTRRTVDLVDLADASTLLRWEVLQSGRLILAGDPDAWRTFQARVSFEWDDLRPFYEREREGLRKVLAGARWSGSTS